MPKKKGPLVKEGEEQRGKGGGNRESKKNAFGLFLS